MILRIGIVFAQQETMEERANAATAFTAKGNEILVKEGNFPKAEGEYRKAIAKNPIDIIPTYNLANAYYATKKYDEATQRYTETIEKATSKIEKHQIYHNQGNTFMEQKQYEKAVEAYKNALRNNPKDNETRYNLALAKELLKKQQEQDEQNKDQNQDNKDNKDQNKDQKDQNKDNKDQEGDNKDDQKEGGDKDKDQKEGGDKEKEDQKGKENEDQKDKSGEQGDKEKEDNKQGDGKPKEQPQTPKRVQGQLSPQQVKSLLEAMNNEEKKVQDKMNAKKVKGAPVKTDKDW